MDAFGIFVLVILAGIAIRVALDPIDRGRIKRYVEEHGGQVDAIHWHPFGKGWLGEKNARIYEVRYSGHDGAVREAVCKTSMLAGVYFTDDRVVHRPTSPSVPTHDSDAATGYTEREVQALIEENRRLRDEIERVRRGGE